MNNSQVDVSRATRPAAPRPFRTAESTFDSRVHVGGATIHYREHGDGDAVVILLHCSASSGTQWRALAKSLEDDCRCVAIDLYGYGESDDWAGDGPLTLADEAAAVLAVMSRYEGPVHLVGHSYGGAVALRLATQEPGRVASLTLIEPVAFHLLKQGGRVGTELYSEIESVADAVNESVLCGNYRGGMACFVNYWNGRGCWEEMKEEARQALSQRSRKVSLDFWSCTHEVTRVEAYEMLPMPTLILWGEQTQRPTAHIAQMLTSTIPGARQHMIAGAGHMSPLSHRELVNELIIAQVTSPQAAANRDAS